MIKAVFKMSAQGKVLSFELSGHSGAAEKGKDTNGDIVLKCPNSIIALTNYLRLED